MKEREFYEWYIRNVLKNLNFDTLKLIYRMCYEWEKA